MIFDYIFVFTPFIGGKFLHVRDIYDVTRPNIVHYMELPASGNDVELCGNVIGIALNGNPGKVELYSLYDSQNNDLSLIVSVTGKAKRTQMLYVQSVNLNQLYTILFKESCCMT